MKMLAIMRIKDGEPAFVYAEPGPTPDPSLKGGMVKGYVLAGHLVLPSGSWGVYIFSSPERDFVDLRKNEGLYEIATVMGAGRTYQDQSLDTPLPANIRNRINAWIAENTSWEQIPAGRTARQVVVELFRRFNPYFDLSKLEIMNYG